MSEGITPALNNNSANGEEWRACPGFPSYEVSSLGRVRRPRGFDSIGRPRHERYLQPSATNGYHVVSLSEGATCRTARIHSLVAAAFLGPRPDGCVVNHLDGVKVNNARLNLEYVSPQENDNHAKRTGLKARGERHGMAKLTVMDVTEIRRHRTARERTNASLAAQYGVSVTTIERILSGRLWKE